MNVISWVLMTLTTIPQGLRLSYDNIKTMSQVYKWKGQMVFQVFDSIAKENRQRTVFRRGYETWSYYQIREFSLKVANLYHMEGLVRGDVVAVAGVQGPRSVALWLGLSRLGVATALVPAAMPPADMAAAAARLHSKAFICHPSLFEELKKQNLGEIVLQSFGPPKDEKETDILKQIDESKPTHHKIYSLSQEIKLLYFFSPKDNVPIPVTNYRYIYVVTNIRKTLDLLPKDIIYAPLQPEVPDTTMVAVGQAMLFGNLVVSGEANDYGNYLADCKRFGTTVAMYNGDVVSQLLAKATSDEDKNHKIRLLAGNGIQDAETWKQIKERYKVPHIAAYYLSLDSNIPHLVNSNGKELAIGFSPFEKVNLVAFNPDTKEVLRNKKGLCKAAALGQPGILIYKFPAPADFARVHFAKNKNVLNDVYVKGDKYINTGDILTKNKKGFYFFVGILDNSNKGKSSAPSG